MAGPRFTISIPCHNEAAVSERKLVNCVSLRANAGIEWLGVDDGSTDATVALVECWLDDRHRTSPVSARLLRNAYQPGKNGALRTAFEAAAGEILLITDADITLGEDVLVRAAGYCAGDA